MRRKTDKDVLKGNLWLILFSVGLILSGIFVATLPAKPVVPYDSLQTKDVTITTLKRHYKRYSTDSYSIRTTEGKTYTISGDYDWRQLKELLKQGTTVTIKWYENPNLLFRNLLAEEIYIGGVQIVKYNNAPADWKTHLAGGACFVALGIGGFRLLQYSLHRNRTQQKKRDARIARKYGKPKK